MRIVALALALSSLVTIAGPARTQDFAGAPLPLKVWLRREAAPFAITRYTAMISQANNKFAFLVPEQFYTRGDPSSGTFTLANAEGNSSITFSVLPAESSDGTGISEDALRERALSESPNGKIIEEFQGFAGGGQGPGFDLQWKASDKVTECKRVVFAFTKAGILEFTMTTSSDNFEKAKSALKGACMSLRFSTDGVLKIPPLPSDS
jgi:hypothetical protein